LKRVREINRKFLQSAAPYTHHQNPRTVDTPLRNPLAPSQSSTTSPSLDPRKGTKSLSSSDSQQPFRIGDLSSLCSGISEPVRLDLAASISLTSSIRLNDIRSVEETFVLTHVGRFEKLLIILERQLFQYLQQQYYPQFIESLEFAHLAAYCSVRDSFAKNAQMTDFLHEFVCPNRMLLWTSPFALGKTYVSYASELGNDDSIAEGLFPAHPASPDVFFVIQATLGNPSHTHMLHYPLHTHTLPIAYAHVTHWLEVLLFLCTLPQFQCLPTFVSDPIFMRYLLLMIDPSC
jgi:hypothetical protein